MVDAKSLAELSSLAKKLNEKSDKINRQIEALNKQLAALNLGMPVWLTRPIASTGLQYDDDRQKFEDKTFLGYTKIDDVWQLAIQLENTTYEVDEENLREEPIQTSAYASLLKVSRDIRLLAIDNFDDLIQAMKNEAREKLKIIEKAEELAKPR